MKKKTITPTYTATMSDGTVIYRKKKGGTGSGLWGELPLGAHAISGDCGTFDRQDIGDPWEDAKFHLESGRTIRIVRDKIIGTEAA